MAIGFLLLGARQQRQVIDNQLLAAVDQPFELINNQPGQDGGRRDGRGQLREFLQAIDEDRVDRLFTLVRLVGPNGVVLADDGLPEVSLGEVSEPVLSTVEINDERYRMIVDRVGPDDQALLQVATNIEGIEGGLARFRMQVLIASAFGIAIAGLLGWVVAQRLSAPISSVSAAAREMAEGSQLPSPIDVQRSDEVGELASSFNAMLSALEISREQQHRLVADASHELRTPLTSLRLKIDLLDANPNLDNAQRQELLASSASEVEQLGELVTELVDLATDPTGTDEPAIPGNLRALAEEVAVRQSRRTGRSITVESADISNADTSNAEAASVMLRPRMVARAISNLVDNAVKYSPDGAPVRVVIDGPRIQVEDEGPGIEPADLDHVFDRFFRSATARTRPGNGIGLAIVRRVAEAHGGQVWARNAEDGSGAIVGFSVQVC